MFLGVDKMIYVGFEAVQVRQQQRSTDFAPMAFLPYARTHNATS